jgi:hypothetical protein
MSLFCLGCVESLPLPKGTEIFLFQVILLFAFVSVFYPLFEFFSLFVPFLFHFLLWLPNVCVVNALIKGEVEDLCGLGPMMVIVDG